MRNGDRNGKARGQRGETIFVLSCVAVFLVIAACAAYFVVRLLA
jgi:hypothetical protein